MHTPNPHEMVRSCRRARVHGLLSRLLIGLFLIGSLPVQAQEPTDGESQNAAEYVAQKEEATRIFLDPQAPKKARLEAATKLGYPEDETFAAMLRIGADPTVDDEIRWQALRQHRFDESYLDVVLSIFEDPADDSADLVGDLVEKVTRRTTFQLPAPIEQRLLAALRGLLDDPRERVRLAAYRSLIGGHDPMAVNRLVEAMNAGEEEVPIPLTDAIELLHLNGSIYHIRTLQPFLDHEDPSVRARAARSLAVDPTRREQIVEMAVRRTSPEEVRLNALWALAREDEGFPGYAIELVTNREESLAIRRAVMKYLTGRMNYREVEIGHQIRFAEAVESLISEPSLTRSQESEELWQEARELLVYLQRAFPAIERHYARR